MSNGDSRFSTNFILCGLCFTFIFWCCLFYEFMCKVSKKKWSFLSIFGAFIPGLNLLWMFMGELDCLLQLRKE